MIIVLTIKRNCGINSHFRLVGEETFLRCYFQPLLVSALSFRSVKQDGYSIGGSEINIYEYNHCDSNKQEDKRVEVVKGRLKALKKVLNDYN